jgi:hypothetical protein
VSSAERFVRHHKQQTDRAINQAYLRLSMNSSACWTFAELLHCVRNRAARLLAAPVVDDHHLGVEALVNLSRFEHQHVRPLGDWLGSGAGWQGAVASLAQHLTGKHPVPRFLAACWYATDPIAESKRQWFVAHAAGVSFRSLDLPIRMTRNMERIFLGSRDHMAIEYAIRRAELLGLDANDELLQAVLATPRARDLRNGEFWRTVWIFLIANARAIDVAQIGPVIDFLQAIRHDRVTVETPTGVVTRGPLQPSFSLKGRTAQSVLRLMNEWHRGLGMAHGGVAWPASPLRPMFVEQAAADPSAPAAVWQLTELTNGAQLRVEGSALRHCVASYADRCWRGGSRIWSLRLRRGEKVRHVLTIEVDMKRRAVVQARGWGNRRPAGTPLRLLQDWAARERLRLAI